MAISHSGLRRRDSGAAGLDKAAVSRSTCLRERGNTLYHEATSQTSLGSVRSSRLQDAIQLYCQALSLSQSDSERAMCCKNLGQAFWARAKLTLALPNNQQQRLGSSLERTSDSLCFDLLSSVSYFLEALAFSRPASQPKEWVQGIHWTLVDIAWTVDDIKEASPLGGHKARILGELCSVFQHKIPSNVKFQASAILHKALAEKGLKTAVHLARTRPQPSLEECFPMLQDCLFGLSVAEAHTDAAATSFLLEIHTLQAAVLKQVEICEDLGKQLSLNASQNRALGGAQDRVFAENSSAQHQNRVFPENSSAQHQNRASGGASIAQNRVLDSKGGSFRAPQRFPGSSKHGKSVSYSEMSSQSRNSMGFDTKGGSFRLPSQQQQLPQFKKNRQESWDLESMFNSLSPLSFLRNLYEKYPPPRKDFAKLGEIREAGELKSAYKRAISHYHPDHNAGLKEGKLSDEITKYLIINFNGLKAAED